MTFVHHLLGTHEVAKRLGVSRERVRQLATIYADFPEPVAVLHSGKVWHSEDLEAWITVHPTRTAGTRVQRRERPPT